LDGDNPSRSEFDLAFSLWAARSTLSRADFARLREVLALPHTEKDIEHIPWKLDTVIQRLDGELPLLPVNRRTINVDADTQPSRRHATPSSPFNSLICWFDPTVLFRNILSSELATTKMHFGMAQYVDKPTEFWHTRAWGSSIRAVSGQFACTSNGDILFPSEFVSFEPKQLGDPQISVKYGRITFIGIDKRSTSSTAGQIVLTLQPVVRVTELTHHLKKRNLTRLSTWILIEDLQLELSVDAIHQRMPFYLYRGDKASEPLYSIKHVLNMKQLVVRSTVKLHTLRAELELNQYGRDYFQSHMSSGNEQSVSMPLQLFIDGFGVFRNTYRSLKGFYLIPACLPYFERRKEMIDVY
jgi:hypothetical protein